MRRMPATNTDQPAARRSAAVRPIASGLKLTAAHFEAIDESHERCAALRVSRIELPDFSPLGRPDLGLARDRNRRLLDHAAPVMGMLYDQIVDSESMVVLTDAAGIIIHSVGDDEFLARASKVALQPGADWSEVAKGTNAVGTTLIRETPTLVHADEHYLHANQFLTCSAVPILDPRGNMLGVLDVSGDHRGYHQHTMALVKMSARMIENHWLTDDHRNVLRLHLHSRGEFIGTLMEGILAISVDGRIVGANRGAIEQLGMSGVALRAHTLQTLFGISVSTLVDRFRAPLGTPMSVHLADGRAFHLHAQFDWPVWSAIAGAAAARPGSPPEAAAASASPVAAAAVPAPRVASPARETALDSLRTGDAQMNLVLDKLQRVVNSDVSILILGESGTGKELVARALHADSARAKRPFVALNCASMAGDLLQVELFGHDDESPSLPRRKGRVGRLVQASGGTLFLNEIGALPEALQARLLRVLVERQITPGGSTQSVGVNVNIICGTQRNLREAIDQGRFRPDLYYRLNGLAVKLPPLRERSDLLSLTRKILEREGGGVRRVLAADVEALLLGYAWPGNVRQLFNVLRTACVMAGSERTITRNHLGDDLLDEVQEHAAAAAAALAMANTCPPASDVEGPLHKLELDAIRRAVAAAGGNVSAASKQLGISRNKIYRRLRWS